MTSSKWAAIGGGVLLLAVLAAPAHADNYGVIFSGGINAANNHDRYYEETLRMWNIMTGTLGYDIDKVYVLFADGTDTGIDRSNGTSSDWSAITGAGGNISSATPGDLQSLLSDLDTIMRPNEDCFHFWSFDHGGNPTWDDSPPTPATLDAGYLCGWMDATGGYKIQDDEFASWVSGIDGYAESYAFGQCFAGDMVDDLNIVSGENRFAAWAAGWFEPSYGRGWVDAWADGLEAGIRSTTELGLYAVQNDLYGPLGHDLEHPGFTGANFDLVTNHPIPEPSSVALVGLGAVALVWLRRRRV